MATDAQKRESFMKYFKNTIQINEIELDIGKKTSDSAERWSALSIAEISWRMNLKINITKTTYMVFLSSVCLMKLTFNNVFQSIINIIGDEINIIEIIIIVIEI